MLDFLRDPIWQGLGCIIGILGIVVGVITAILGFRLQQQRKKLVYDIETFTPLLSVKPEIKGKIQILYEGQLINEQIYLMIVKLQNTGNVPILPVDYDQPITINADKQAKILTAEIIDVSPKTLNPSLSTEETNIQLAPILLNQGDYISIKGLICNTTSITVNGRIVGVKEITGEYPSQRLNRQTNFELIFSILYLISIIFLSRGWIQGILGGLLIILLAFGGLLYVILKTLNLKGKNSKYF